MSQKSGNWLQFSEVLDEGRDGDIPVAWSPARLGEFRRLSEFREDTMRVAAALSARSEERWALCFDDTWWMAVTFFAAIYAGKRIAIPGHCREALLREQRENFDAIATDIPLDPGIPVLDVARTAKTQSPLHPLPLWPGEAEVSFFTSGSTGKPKEIRKTLAVLQRENDAHGIRWGGRLPGACVAGTTSHQHLYGFQFRMLLPITFAVPFNTELVEYHEQLLAPELQPFALITSPAFLKRLDEKLEKPHCCHVLSAGGFLAPSDADLCSRTLGLFPLEIYGSTEAGAIAWRDNAVEREFWTPVPGVKAACDEDGRLSLGSPFLPDGEVLVTDDRIEPEYQGGEIQRFRLLGRLDRTVKIEEKRIFLPEIEQRILSLSELVSDVAVVPLQDSHRTVIAAALVLKEEGRRRYLSEGHGRFLLGLRQYLRAYLEPVALPRHLVIVDAIPSNLQGKRRLEDMQALFKKASVEIIPRERILSKSGEELLVELEASGELLWFQGHFKGCQLLPGVAQLYWITRYADRFFDTRGRIPKIDTIKFVRPVAPGEKIRMQLTWNAREKQLSFNCTVEGITACRGRIEFSLP